MNFVLGFEELFDSERVAEHARKTDQPGGVFRVQVREPGDAGDTGRYTPLPRLLDVDPLGQLYIAWSDDFLLTARELNGSARPGLHGAAPFWTTYGQQPRIQSAFPQERFAVAFLSRMAPADAGRRALAVYRYRFGEYPPLNGSL